MHIRQATVLDAERISEIYNREVLGSTATLDLVPRTIEEQRRWIEARSGGLAAVVAIVDDRVAGFGSLSFYRDRPGYRTSVENSVYVAQEAQGCGVGAAILSHLLEVAKVHGYHTVIARIVGPQEASVNLHTKAGFDMVGIERQIGRKFGRWHDVALMQKLL